MLTHALRALYADGGVASIVRRWEFREESPVEGTNRSLFIAMGVIAILSLGSTFGLLSFLTHRFIYWQRYYKRPLAKNQYVVLIYNLLLVDLQQSIAFLISLHWAARGSTHFGETACYLQGWWIQTGDTGSGLFVLSIALHTSAVVLRGRQLPFNIFVYCVIALWIFILILGFIPVGLYGSKVFVITEANWVCTFTFLMLEQHSPKFKFDSLVLAEPEKPKRTTMGPLSLDFPFRVRYSRPLRDHVLLPPTPYDPSEDAPAWTTRELAPPQPRCNLHGHLSPGLRGLVATTCGGSYGNRSR
jgi:hypothetical protein